jgi:hypothetical protein
MLLLRAIWALFAIPPAKLDLEWTRWKIRRAQRRIRRRGCGRS